MRSITANYRKVESRNPNLGAYPCLVRVVRGKEFSRKSLVKAFNELMPENEYARNEKKELIDYLENQSSLAEEVEFGLK